MRLRASLLTSGVVAIVLAGFIWYVVATVQQSLLTQAGERARTSAMILAGQTAATSQTGLNRFQDLAREAVVRGFIEAPDSHARATLVNRLQRYAAPDADQIMELWTRDGDRVIADLYPADSQTPFRTGVRPTGPGLNPLETHGGKLFTRIVADVPGDGNGPPLGYLQLVRLVKPTPSTTVTGIVGGGATVLIGNLSGQVWTDLGGLVAPAPVDTSRSDPQEFTAPDGRRMIGAVSPIAGTPWVTLIELPRDIVLAPAWQLLRRLLAAGLGFLFVTIIVSALLSRTVTTPVVELTEAVRTITRGDYSSRVAATRRDEVGRLGRAFNDMAGQIESARRELEARADELHASREAADRANRVKDEFLAVLSHELRSPLSAMLGWCHMLREGAVAPERRAHAIEVIERNAREQLRLVEDLLDVSRIVAGKFALDRQVIDPALVVQAAVESVQPAALAKQIGLTAAIDASAGHINGDAGRLQQAVGNLLANALKFTPAGGHIRVSLERVPAGIEIAVRDNGRGVAPDALPLLFDRLHQGESGLTRRQSGLGLGLAIVREIIQQHGGSVRAESAGPGSGATFRILIPAVAAASALAASRPEPDPASAAGSLRGLNILVVEDAQDTRELLVEMLTREGAGVEAVAGADEAMASLDRRRPDLIVSDVEMPNEDGLSFMQRVRTRPAQNGGNVPAIALTAYATLDDRARSLAAGFQAHVSKPLDIAELQRAIARVMTLTLVN